MTRTDLLERAARAVDALSDEQARRLAEIEPELIALSVPTDEPFDDEAAFTLRIAVHRLCRARLGIRDSAPPR